MLLGDIEIKEWLHSMGIYDYDICDGVVHVVGDVNLNISNMGLTSIPVQFGYVSGYFRCRSNYLESLEGFPNEVGGDFDCSYNYRLYSLEGGPSEVGGSFYCRGNDLRSLAGCPNEVGGGFNCSNNMFKDKPDTSGIKIGGRFLWK
jgi:hypothetical protein